LNHGKSQSVAIGLRAHGHLIVNDSSNRASDVELSSDGGDGVDVAIKIDMKTEDAVRGTAVHDAAFRVFWNKKNNVLEGLEVGFARCRLEAGETNEAGH
jgi:predicted lipoprotein